MYYVYVIESEKNKKRYIGCTNNLRRRVKEHNNKENKTTKSGIPWKVIYYEAFLIAKDAYIREKIMKGQWGNKFLRRVLKNYLLK